MSNLNASFLKELSAAATCFGLLFAGFSVSAQTVEERFGDAAADPIDCSNADKARTRAVIWRRQSDSTSRHSRCGQSFRKRGFRWAMRSPHSDVWRKLMRPFKSRDLLQEKLVVSVLGTWRPLDATVA